MGVISNQQIYSYSKKLDDNKRTQKVDFKYIYVAIVTNIFK